MMLATRCIILFVPNITAFTVSWPLLRMRLMNVRSNRRSMVVTANIINVRYSEAPKSGMSTLVNMPRNDV